MIIDGQRMSTQNNLELSTESKASEPFLTNLSSDFNGLKERLRGTVSNFLESAAKRLVNRFKLFICKKGFIVEDLGFLKLFIGLLSTVGELLYRIHSLIDHQLSSSIVP